MDVLRVCVCRGYDAGLCAALSMMPKSLRQRRWKFPKDCSYCFEQNKILNAYGSDIARLALAVPFLYLSY